MLMTDKVKVEIITLKLIQLKNKSIWRNITISPKIKHSGVPNNLQSTLLNSSIELPTTYASKQGTIYLGIQKILTIINVTIFLSRIRGKPLKSNNIVSYVISEPIL